MHEDPDFDKLNSFAETARSFGYQVGDLSNRAHVQQLLDAAKGNPDEHVIKLGLLKSLKRAQYDVEPLGHYGLAKTDYCHFTSPIRRYADLIIHRSLQSLLRNSPKNPDRTPTQRELMEISQHISATERTSAGAESETKQLKLMEWLAKAGEMKDAPTFEGMITEVRPMGLFVEAIAIGMKGVVKREDLPPGDWYFDSARLRFSSRSGHEYRAGQAVPLRVGKVDFERKFVDFTIAGEAREPARRSAKKQQNLSLNPRRKSHPSPRSSVDRKSRTPQKNPDLQETTMLLLQRTNPARRIGASVDLRQLYCQALQSCCVVRFVFAEAAFEGMKFPSQVRRMHEGLEVVLPRLLPAALAQQRWQ